jgi:glutathione S-transferase
LITYTKHVVYTFYTNELCTFCHRATIALNEVFGAKMAELVKIIPIDLGNMPEWYIKTINPNAVVPTLQLDGSGEFMYESAVIAEFLLEQHSESVKKSSPSDEIIIEGYRNYAK